MKIQDKQKRRNIFIIAALILIALPIISKIWVHSFARNHIYTVASVPHNRVALVLGCKVQKNGKLSESLASRCDMAIELYKARKVNKLLMSGDNRFIRYNEPEHMRNYAIEQGVPAKDVVTDFAGRRTYDSIYRAKHVFGLNQLTVVTQDFHIDRSLFLCKIIGVDACGVPARAVGNARSKIREVPACMGAIIDAYLRQPRPVMGKKEKIL